MANVIVHKINTRHHVYKILSMTTSGKIYPGNNGTYTVLVWRASPFNGTYTVHAHVLDKK